MIKINKKEDCCGCSACAQRCPKQCITMQADGEGFLYPIVDIENCIDCGLCEKVCPVINQSEPNKPLKVYATMNKDEEVRLASSSGGIFTLLAEATILKGGVVFGVRFNEQWMPVFDYTETIEGIAPFRGSKYVQATVGNAYKQTEEFLKAGREVLFSGTPCQVAGLKKFLRKEYDNLFTVDIICHGVPSPKVWSKYLDETCSKLLMLSPDEKNSVRSAKGGDIRTCIETVSFRSKSSGWKKYSFLLKLNFPTCDGKNTVVFSEELGKNDYMRAFLSDTILRPSCYSCPAKEGKSHSDVTIADFWGINNINPEFDDDKGCGAVLINTTKGEELLPFEKCDVKLYDIQNVIKYNPAYYRSCKQHPNRNKFFKGLDNSSNFHNYTNKMLEPSFAIKAKRKAKSLVKRVLRTMRITK